MYYVVMAVDGVNIHAVTSPIWHDEEIPTRIEDGLVRIRLDLTLVCARSGLCQVMFEDVRCIADDAGGR